MKHKVSELEGALLDAAVAMAEGDRLPDYWLDPDDGTPWLRPGREEWHPSARWDQGGPIIEREGIAPFSYTHEGVRYWAANMEGQFPRGEHGTTSLLVAAMRAYVASKLGKTVELP